MLFAAVLLIAYLDARRRGELRGVAGSVWAAGAAMVALGIGQLIGNAVDRARPYDTLSGVHVLIDRTKDFSFPSDHSTVAGAVAAGLVLACRGISGGRRPWGVVAVVLAVLMAFARVYVGAHYPGDVLVGLALGALVAVAGWFVVVPALQRIAEWLSRNKARVLVTARPH